jgi:hypothetical protein
MAKNDVPNIFSQLVKSASNSAAGGYPYQIKAADLDKNFVYATLEIDATLVQETSGQEGFTKRKLKIPAVPGSGTKNLTASSGALAWTDAIPTPPSSGTHVLGAVDGALTWIATEEC